MNVPQQKKQNTKNAHHRDAEEQLVDASDDPISRSRVGNPMPHTAEPVPDDKRGGLGPLISLSDGDHHEAPGHGQRRTWMWCALPGDTGVRQKDDLNQGPRDNNHSHGSRRHDTHPKLLTRSPVSGPKKSIEVIHTTEGLRQ